MAGIPPPRTLDIREPQVLRHYPHDAHGFFWHHRVLLCKITPGQFIALTPDGDLERINLLEVDHLPLERRSDFPAPQSPYVYAFDELGRNELERFKRRAQQMASLFNDTPVDDIEAYEWLICESNNARFGEVVGDDVIDQGVTLGDSGIVTLDGKEVFVKRVALSDKAATLTKLDPSRGDIRLLCDYRDDQGRRFLDLRQAINLLTEDEMKDWPLQGPRVMVEFLRAVRSGPGDLATYHLSWAKSSGVNIYSMACHDHRIICNVLRAALEIDQLNIGNTLSLELLARRLVQIETAVSRCPGSPDFSGPEMILEDPIGSGGEANTTVFNVWLASKLKEKANIAKQSRLYKEEFRGGSAASEPAPHPDSSGAPPPKGRGRGRGRGQPKAKASAGGGAGTPG